VLLPPGKYLTCSKEASYSKSAKHRYVTLQKPCVQQLKTMLSEPAFKEKYKEFYY